MPSGAVTDAVTPIISAVFTCASLRFKFAALVVIEFGNIANSEVPRATRSDAPNSIDSDGTASAPPPMPSSPASVPMTTPSNAKPMPVTTVMTIWWSRDGTKLT